VRESNKYIPAYSIKDIARWQTELQNESGVAVKEKIVLPSLQRGFVWKPHQIESLWDSILRGYPIGSILMSQNGLSKELLDGQQRSTSIALGHYDPITDSGFDFLSFNKDKEKSFTAKSIIPLIWIDLKPLDNSKNGLKYGLRVLTKSHPWGYQLNDHTKPLSVSQRSKALAYYQSKFKKIYDEKELDSFTKIPNSLKTPWDAYFPVPLVVLLKADTSTNEIFKKTILSYCTDNLNQIKNQHSNDLYIDFNKVRDEWFNEIREAILRSQNLLIPEILVEKENLIDEKEENENTSALFVRLNSEGTRISGEELVYSYFKATFPELKNAVESIDYQFIKPSKIINIISRLILGAKDKSNLSFGQNVSLKVFRNEINDDNSTFRKRLSNFISNKENESEAKNLFDQAISLITKKEEIPKVFYKDCILSSTDLFYVLLTFLRKNSKFTISEVDKEFIYKSFIYISKFKIDDRKVSQKIFEELKAQRSPFSNWKEAVKKVVNTHPKILPPLLNPANFEFFLIDILLTSYLQSENTHFNDINFIRQIISEHRNETKFLFVHKIAEGRENEVELDNQKLSDAAEYWQNLASNLYGNKSFLIVAQSDYFRNEFNDFIQFESILDTNKPWDWDHIYPHSWIHYRPGISQKVRQVINLNGNFRALSFNDNRSENNHDSPEKRFNGKEDVQKNSFIEESDLPFWLKLDGSARSIKSQNLNEESNLLNAIFYRISNIYKTFYEKFNLE
jgi:hypothetical protein